MTHDLSPPADEAISLVATSETCLSKLKSVGTEKSKEALSVDGGELVLGAAILLLRFARRRSVCAFEEKLTTVPGCAPTVDCAASLPTVDEGRAGPLPAGSFGLGGIVIE